MCNSGTVALMTTPDDVQKIFSTIFDVDSLTLDERQKLGPKVREARLSLGMKQAELADAAGISRKTLSDLEQGRRGAQAGVLHKVLSALGVPQVGDAETKYSEATQLFIASTAPIFDTLPVDEQSGAHEDVVALLASRLARANRGGLRLVSGMDEGERRAASHDQGGLEESDLD